MSKVSALGTYRGFSEEVADGYVRTSEHVTVDDGCRIAVDILRPTRKEAPLGGPFPVVFQATGYLRSYRKPARSAHTYRTALETERYPVGHPLTVYELSPDCRLFLHHGYAVAVMDVRGTGASFGPDAFGAWRAAADAAQVVDWIAAQPWCTGRVGMVGGSWLGIIQLMIAAYHPQSLACIVPQVAAPGCRVAFEEGVYVQGFERDWSDLRRFQDDDVHALPIDGPEGEALLTEALAQRKALYPHVEGIDYSVVTMDAAEAITANGAPPPPLPDLGPLGDPFEQTERLNASGVPTYLQTGWWDMTFAGHNLDLFRALTVPKRLLVGPWNHGGRCAVETLRWFDHWLKDIDNGITDEPPLVFSTSDPDGTVVWQTAEGWPLPEVTSRVLHLSPGSSGTVSSVLDGSLEERVLSETSVDYTVDYAVSLGDRTRHRFMFRSLGIRLPDLTERAKRCLTFTTAPLEEAIELTGRPTLNLALATTAADGIIVVTLEQVRPDGSVRYLTEGFLSLFHRTVSACPRPHEGRAWHSVRAADLLPVEPGQTMEVSLELFPISVLVERGSRVRLTIAGADADNLYTPTHEPAPVWTLALGGERGARLELPVVDASRTRAARVVDQAFADDNVLFAFERD